MGAGRSMFGEARCRFYDPTVGRVLVDGHDLRECRTARFRRRLGHCRSESPRHDPLQHGHGRPDATDLERAARAVGAHDLVRGLADGYHTPVSETGRSLSAGQRQRPAPGPGAQLVDRDPSSTRPTSNLDLATEEARW